jgi:hypothetical protein
VNWKQIERRRGKEKNETRIKARETRDRRKRKKEKKRGGKKIKQRRET